MARIQYQPREKYRDRRMKRFYFRIAVLLIFIVVPVMSGYYAYRYVADIVSRSDDEAVRAISVHEALEINIPMGSSTDDIVSLLTEKKIISRPRLYKLLSKLNGYDNKYRSGVHAVSTAENYNTIIGYDNLMRILSGKPKSNPTKMVAIPEGKTYNWIARKFEDEGIITKEELDKAVEERIFDYEFLKDIPGQRENYLEGYLFPETYEFYINGGAEHILGKMLGQFDEEFNENYRKRAEALGMSMDEIIILASMIEKEAARERDIISSVFHNRLKHRDPTLNRLQSCATIQYIFLQEQGIVKETISLEDTEIDNVYNTYKYSGLPPGPICSPGIDSIRAALYPENTDYLYFVARGDGTGTHEFNTNYRDHVNAMHKYNQILN